VAVALTDQQQVQLSVSALDADGQPDPNATITWAEDSNGSIITLDNTTGDTVNAIAVTGANGSANVTATASDSDGNSVTSPPLQIAVTTSTDAVQVSISAGTPTPKNP